MTRYEMERLTARLEEYQREQLRLEIQRYTDALEAIQYLAARVAELEAKYERD